MASILSKPVGGQVLGQLFEEVSTTQYHEIGYTVHCEDGTVFKYGIAGEALTGQGYAVQFDTNGDLEMVDDASVADNPNNIGVVAANSAVADNEYCWVCVVKPASNTTLGVVCAASTAADAGLYAGGTGGILDGVATSGTLLHGIRLLTASPTTAGVMNTASEWNYPHASEA